MPNGLLPLAAEDTNAAAGDPQAVAEAFLAALAEGDVDAAGALVDDDIVYVNVSLPAVRGRVEFNKVLALLASDRNGFEVYLHAISANGETVLTERTDVILLGKLRLQFWVWGRFDVVDGKITLWRDSFDFVDILRATVRGIAALAVPSLSPRPPVGPNDAPGRP